MLYIVARSIEQGRMAGIVSTMGIGLASTVHVVFAALGLSALLLQSALAFSIVKYLGAAYLIFLGFRTLMSKSPFEKRHQLFGISGKRTCNVGRAQLYRHAAEIDRGELVDNSRL